MTVMKNLIFFSAIAILATSCTFYEVEPRYDHREKFIGYYDVEEFSETYGDYTNYEMRISRGLREDEIYLHNFYASEIRVYAIVSFDNIRIPYQVVDGYEIEGTGTWYRSELDLSYRVKDLYNNTRADYCETVAWR